MKIDQRQRILEAAKRVIAREGFQRATIQKIAQEAGLKSPSLIYWYFESKKELFQTMMESMSPILSQLQSLWTRIDDPPEDVLLLIARAYLDTFDNPNIRQLFRIFFSEAALVPETANNFAEKAVLMLNFVVAYLEHQIEIGRLRPHNTQSGARSFIGSLVVYILGRELFLPLRAGLPEPELYAREVVNIFLRGLSAEKNSGTDGSQGGF